MARRHRWSSATVAEGLQRLAAGASYSKVSKWALRQLGEEPSGATPSDRSKNHWQIAAGWVESFAPVVWEQLDDSLRERALALRSHNDDLIARGQLSNTPLCLVVDELPVFVRDPVSKKKTIENGFYILVAAEYVWLPGPWQAPDLRIRLARAMPKANTQAWRLVFDEIGYEPDVVTADGSTSITAAFDAHYDSAKTTLIPCLWHLRNGIAGILGKSQMLVSRRGASRLIAPLRNHLKQLTSRDTTPSDPTAVTDWFDTLDMLVAAADGPSDAVVAVRNQYEQRLLNALPAVSTYPQAPLSTGGLETLIRDEVEPLLKNRAHVFGNLERTNRYLDLFVAGQQGALDNTARLARYLRNDAIAHDGWAHSTKQVDDPWGHGKYQSLKDTALINDVARARNLT